MRVLQKLEKIFFNKNMNFMYEIQSLDKNLKINLKIFTFKILRFHIFYI